MSTTPPIDPVPPDPNTPPGGDPTIPYTTGTPIPDPADVEKNKIFAILAYLNLLVLVPIFAAKDSPFARYHANQGLILLLVTIAVAFTLAIVSGIIAVIPVVQMCACAFIPLFGLVGLGWLALAIYGIINAAGGKMVPLPVIGNYTLLK